MIEIINECLSALNHLGDVFSSHAADAFLQSALLVILLFGIDLLLRKRVRAVIRYGVWLLVLVKLVLPPTLALPTGVGYWLGDRLPTASPVSERFAATVGFESDGRHQLASPQPSGGSLPAEPPANAVEPVAPIPSAVLTLTPISWQAVVFLLWLVGVFAFAALLAQRVRFVRGLVAASAPAEGELLRVLEQCRRQMGVRRQVGLRTSEAVPSPAVCGLLRPIVLMPTSLVDRLSPERLRAALIHELAHIKRADLWINAMQTFLQVVYFYNPFVWFANAIIRRTCEEAVDETVLVTLGGRAKDYSNTLIDIGEMAFWKADFGLRLIGVAESKRALQGRIKHMLTRPVPKSARIGVLGTIAILVVAAVLLPMARAEKSSHEPSAPAPATAAPATEKTPVASESDTIVDPNTGLKFTVAKRITGENDVIVEDYRPRPSPNGRFLLYAGQVVPVDGGKPFKLEALHGTEDAAWSPDGTLIAYRDKLTAWLLPVSPETGKPTGPARKLLEEQLHWSECEILWSRDSQWILLSGHYNGYQHRMVSVQDGRAIEPPDCTRFGLRSPDQKYIAYFKPRNGIWTMPVQGGASRLVVGEINWGVPQSLTVPLWWSPDGQWLLCGLGRLGSNHQQFHFVRLADHREVIIKPTALANSREVVLRLPEGIGHRALGVSPDGKKLQFYKSSYESRDVLKVARIGGGAPTELGFSGLVGLDRACGPFSRDGQQWFFMGCKPGIGDEMETWVPYVAASATADPVEVRLPEEVRREGAFNWWGAWRWRLSPDGKQLIREDEYITARGEGISDIYLIPISLEKAENTGPATLIFKEGRWTNRDLTWSPDLSRLVILATVKDEIELWVLSPDGSPPRQLTHTPKEAEWEPKWSPDGKFIAYNMHSAGSPGEASLYVIPSEGGVPKRLWTKPGDDLGRYQWFPNSREIGLVSDDALVTIDIADGSVRPYLKLAEAGFTRLKWFQWSRDGQTLGLYGAKGDEFGPVTLLRASDKRIEVLPDPDPAEKSYLRWTGDSQAISYRTWRSEKTRPAGLIYDLDIEEAWIKAKNRVAGESSPASVSPVAKLEAPPLVNGEFRDNFEDGDTKYWTFEDEDTDKRYERVHEAQNGELVLENTCAILGLPEWTNYVVTVKACIKERGGTVVGFRGTEHSEYCLSATAEGFSLGIYHPDASWGRYGRKGMLAEAAYNLAQDKWCTIQVEVRGPHIVVRVDGQSLIDLNDENCPRGAVMLFSDVNSRVHFDDFSVRLLP